MPERVTEVQLGTEMNKRRNQETRQPIEIHREDGTKYYVAKMFQTPEGRLAFLEGDEILDT